MKTKKKTYSLVIETKSLADLLQATDLTGEVMAGVANVICNPREQQKRMIETVLVIRKRYHDMQQQTYPSVTSAFEAFRKVSGGNKKYLVSMVLVSAYCHETGDFTDLRNTAGPLRKEEV